MERVKIGEVGVDSGTLIVLDPCYVEGEWKPSSSERVEEVWVRPDTGDSGGLEKAREWHRAGIETVRLSPPGWLGGGSYEDCASAVADDIRQGGPVGNGFGVAFRTGLGDGRYGVFAEYEDIPDWGRRIVRIVIEFFGDEEEVR